MGKTGSLEQCASSDSVHDESYGNQGQDMKAALFMSNQEMSPNASQGEITQPVFPSQVPFPYVYPDPFYGGLYTMYGPHNMIQPPLMAAAMAPGRVPLPVDIPEDGPIYVNAKQYHGILRRRQTRAKLEAQNKLVKTRKPYLHESRHQHALNRVRGSGGRFLSSKKTQPLPDSAPPSSSCGTPLETLHFNEKLNSINSNKHEIEANNFMATSMGQGIPDSTASDGRFTTIPPHMAVPVQGSGGGLPYNGSRCYASIVR